MKEFGRKDANGDPLMRRRLVNVFEVFDDDIDYEDMDADEVIKHPKQCGCFVNVNTLEPELFASGMGEAMQAVIAQELRLRQASRDAVQEWVDDPDQVDEDRLLRWIERIGKGRFAQALAPSVSEEVCPVYIRSALEYIRDAVA